MPAAEHARQATEKLASRMLQHPPSENLQSELNASAVRVRETFNRVFQQKPAANEHEWKRIYANVLPVRNMLFYQKIYLWQSVQFGGISGKGLIFGSVVSVTCPGLPWISG